MTTNHFSRNQKGFTLIEILISTTIFVIVSAGMLGVYNYILRLNQQAQAIRTATDNVRFMTEFLSREIRNGQIQYSGRPSVCNTTLANPSLFVSIVNVDGDTECFYVSDQTGTALRTTGSYLWLVKVTGSTVLPATMINPTGVTIQNFKFIVQPLSDPYAGNAVQQESITFSGNLTSSPNPKVVVKVPFQTSISLPLYDIP